MENILNKSAPIGAAAKRPCLVQTSQGFSVSYDNKFLYSKYAPSKAILNKIDSLQIQPQTIILCISPVLIYGLLELSKKLPEDCIMLGCEAEPSLLEFINENKENFSSIPHFSFLSESELLNLGPILTKNEYILKSGFSLPDAGTFRRIIPIDFSAGAQLHQDLYQKVYSNAVNALMTFWANRVTLVKFGRKYCSSFYKNLKKLPETVPIQNYFSSITKPIVVFGAGESTDKGIKYLLEIIEKEKTNPFYILCADTALQPLITSNIIPDGVFIEETQSVIVKCFLGTNNSKTQIFAGLSSVPSLSHIYPLNQISYFTTVFADSMFMKKLQNKNLLPPQNEPFGSVGLTTLFYALQFRANEDIPVYFYGLDFSYSSGRTHAKGTMAYKNLELNETRLLPGTNFSSAFSDPAFKVSSENQTIFSTPVLNRYAELLSFYFKDTKNLYNSSDFGINLNIQKKLPEPLQKAQKSSEKICLENGTFSKEFTDSLENYFTNEHNELLEIKNTLTGNKKIPEEELQDSITKLLKNKEYLFLHFPDGQKFVYSQSFLNRIRAQLDYFLRIIK